MKHHTAGGYRTIVDLAGAGNIILYADSNNNHFTLYKGGPETLGPTLTLDQWYYVAVTQTVGDVMTVYLDAVQQIQVTAVTTAVGALRFGSNTGWGEPGDITIAYARAWSSVLSAAQLAAEKDSTTPVVTAGLLADWRLVDGNMLADSSGANNPLILTGTVPWAADPTLSGGGGGGGSTSRKAIVAPRGSRLYRS
jgi:hypothetical protein